MKKNNEIKVWSAMDVASMEQIASIINRPEMIKLCEEAVVTIETQKIMKLIK